MRQAMEDVRKFHEKHGFDIGIDATASADDLSTELRTSLSQIAAVLHSFSVSLEHAPGVKYNAHLLRAHLSLEELAEYIDALLSGNRVKMFDALVDRAYVLIGDAVTFGFPLPEGFDEVQRSNMTKAVRNKDDLRLRDKGASYVPPDLERVLAMHDNKNMLPTTLTIELAMHTRGALQEHRGWWAMLEKPDAVVGGAIQFVCHDVIVERGTITRIREPSTDRPADWTGKDFDSSWWIVEYTNTEIEFMREDFGR